jgi:hypothetical protein
MKRYHITYYTQRTPSPLLAGVTVEAINIIDAMTIVLNQGVDVNQIKYAIEL